MTIEQKLETILEFIKTTISDKAAIIGISGGIDSAVVAALLKEAVAVDQITALFLPDSLKGEDQRMAYRRVNELVGHLGIWKKTIQIEPQVAALEDAIDPDGLDRLSLGNLKARTRMAIQYGIANATGGLVVGTGNKSELAIGYFTKYGDGGVDLLPIGGLYKTEVYKAANLLDIPPSIVNAAPSAGLWPGQTDEGEMGMSYETLDRILASENGETLDQLDGIPDADIEKVKKLRLGAIHKLNLPPIILFD